jgi:hypothetical protein
MPYEQTFVGLFAAAFPQLDILNAAAASYAPTIYYAKAKYLIEAGLQVNEVIVYIDISDIMLSQLSKDLPNALDHATPHGRIPDNAELQRHWV